MGEVRGAPGCRLGGIELGPGRERCPGLLVELVLQIHDLRAHAFVLVARFALLVMRHQREDERGQQQYGDRCILACGPRCAPHWLPVTGRIGESSGRCETESITAMPLLALV
ncbi:hypothetical protein CAL22_05890 [Bordetella genomosp. 12]|uniref:Uncharacterized protein n=1 Tax=Bordetella genomosp. 12 TaxID=463035 RepID=A0A261VKC3_9BORD|nr:hypothetical protein CAL22_05890 [Bordetella genomosp. 12]